MLDRRYSDEPFDLIKELTAISTSTLRSLDITTPFDITTITILPFVDQILGLPSIRKVNDLLLWVDGWSEEEDQRPAGYEAWLAAWSQRGVDIAIVDYQLDDD